MSLRYLFREFRKNACARSILLRTARFWNRLPYNLCVFSHSNNEVAQKIMEHLDYPLLKFHVSSLNITCKMSIYY